MVVQGLSRRRDSVRFPPPKLMIVLAWIRDEITFAEMLEMLRMKENEQ